MAGPDLNLTSDSLEQSITAAATKAGSTTGAQAGLAKFLGEYLGANGVLLKPGYRYEVLVEIGSPFASQFSYIRTTGSTDVDYALEQAYSTVSAATPASKRVVLITDGISATAVQESALAKYLSDSAVALDVVARGGHADKVAMKTWADDAGGSFYVAQ